MKNILIRSTLVWLAGGLVLAQGPPSKVEVYESTAKDVSKTLPEMVKSVVTVGAPAQEKFLGRIPFTGSENGIQKPDPVLQPGTLPSMSVTTGAGFAGLGLGFPGFTLQYAPPDTNASVGDDQIVQWVNAAFAVFNKATHASLGVFPGNAPWAGFGGGCQNNNDGDPIVLWDKQAHRWVFTQFSVSTKPYLQCFAISTGTSALGPYNRFAFSFGNTDFPDYPKMGVWPDSSNNAYLMSFNIFRNGFFFSGPRACAVDRAKALAGLAPIMICFQLGSSNGTLMASDQDGAALPPANSPGYFLAYGTNSLKLWQIRPNFVNFSSSTLTGPSTINVASFSRACSGGACIPQPGTSQKLDSLADRLMYRLAYRNFTGSGAHESLVVNHSVTPGNGASSGIRWYELRKSGTGAFSLFQQGTFSPDTTSRWMGSAAMDKNGNIVVGYSASSSSVFPEIRVAAHCATATLGQLAAEAIIQTGAGSQLPSLSRWGDYSSLSVDPSDDTTLWYTTEYLTQNGTFNWSTRIVPVTANCP